MPEEKTEITLADFDLPENENDPVQQFNIFDNIIQSANFDNYGIRWTSREIIGEGIINVRGLRDGYGF